MCRVVLLKLPNQDDGHLLQHVLGPMEVGHERRYVGRHKRLGLCPVDSKLFGTVHRRNAVSRMSSDCLTLLTIVNLPMESNRYRKMIAPRQSPPFPGQGGARHADRHREMDLPGLLPLGVALEPVMSKQGGLLKIPTSWGIVDACGALCRNSPVRKLPIMVPWKAHRSDNILRV